MFLIMLHFQYRMAAKKLSIIIPVYNEFRTIGKIFQAVQTAPLPPGWEREIIVVDDGSTDGSGEIIQGLGRECRLIVQKRNQGKGAAVRAGLKAASGDFVIIQDADLEYNPQEYQKLLKAAIGQNADVVYGSRRLGRPWRDVKTSHWRFWLGGVALTWLTNLLYGTKLTDEPTGYKLFRREVLDKINLTCQRFEFCPEVTAKLAKRGVKILEASISYNPRSVQDGKKIKLRDFWQAIWILIKYRFID